jgi:hypothetical protein
VENTAKDERRKKGGRSLSLGKRGERKGVELAIDKSKPEDSQHLLESVSVKV